MMPRPTRFSIKKTRRHSSPSAYCTKYCFMSLGITMLASSDGVHRYLRGSVENAFATATICSHRNGSHVDGNANPLLPSLFAWLFPALLVPLRKCKNLPNDVICCHSSSSFIHNTGWRMMRFRRCLSLSVCCCVAWSRRGPPQTESWNINRGKTYHSSTSLLNEWNKKNHL